MHGTPFGAGSGTGLRRAGEPFRLRGRIDSRMPHPQQVVTPDDHH